MQFSHDFDLIMAALDVLVCNVVAILAGDVRLSDGFLQSVAVFASPEVSDDFAVAIHRFQAPDGNL